MHYQSDLKILKSECLVRFQDCDPFKHLNNLKYIEYFINAREDHLRQFYDLDIYKYMSDNGEGWVVSTNRIAYLQSAMLMQQVVIESQLIEYSPRSLHVEMRMYDKSYSHVKSLMWIKFAYVNIAQARSGKHPDHMMQFFEQVHQPVEEPSFEDRTMTLRKYSG